MNEDIEETNKTNDNSTHLPQSYIDRLVREDEYRIQEEDHSDFAKRVKQKFDFKTMRDTEEVYVFHNGIYEKDGERVISSYVESIKNPCTTNFVNEVINHIKRSTYTKREEFDKYPNLLTLENGILDMENMQLQEFDKDYLSLSRIPVFFNKEAKCPNIMKFISEIVRLEDQTKLYEIIGYCLEKSYFIHKAFMLVGSGFNGKTTFLDLLKAFLGKNNISHIPLQELGDKFAKANLFKKYANLCNDISSKALNETGDFKGLCGEDWMNADVKFKEPFDFLNYAKLIFACNTMPKTKDITDAFFGRWEIIPFINIFDKNNPNTDKNLLSKLTTQEELSGLLNLTLKSLKDLKKNKEFTNSQNTEDMRTYYQKLSNPVFAFIDDECTLDQESAITKADLYQAFVKYADLKKLGKVNQTMFSLEIKAQGIKDYRGSDEKRTHYWHGIRLATDQERTDKGLDNFV
jgi:P4 family phage/plasmid primase-like protien